MYELINYFEPFCTSIHTRVRSLFNTGPAISNQHEHYSKEIQPKLPKDIPYHRTTIDKAKKESLPKKTAIARTYTNIPYGRPALLRLIQFTRTFSPPHSNIEEHNSGQIKNARSKQ
jgi:hypothetical protein